MVIAEGASRGEPASWSEATKLAAPMVGRQIKVRSSCA